MYFLLPPPPVTQILRSRTLISRAKVPATTNDATEAAVTRVMAAAAGDLAAAADVVGAP